MTIELDQLSDSIPHQIAGVGADGRITYANTAFERRYGISRDQLVGMTVVDAVGKPLGEQYAPFVERALKGEAGAIDHVFPVPGEGRAWRTSFVPTVEGACVLVSDDPGNQSMQSVRDQRTKSRLAELEDRVKVRTAEFEAANRELEAFCYSVSHDLRAPLRSIDGFAYALFQDYGDKLDGEALEYINRIRGSAKRMDELISALLVLSRITRVELEQETVDLSDLAESVAAELMHQNPGRAIEISIHPNLQVRADRRMLRVVLDNLIGNAMKFTVRASEARITLGHDSQSGAFFVEDNGVGFNMEESSKLFQPFEQLHSPREFIGSGIGLATVQRIIRKHGGEIWAQAEEGKGAKFFFTL